MIIAAEVTAASQLFNFHFDKQYLSDVGYPEPTLEWQFGQTTNPAIWATIVLIIILLVNFLPVRAFGEIEYVFGCCKMIFICLLIILNMVINAFSFGSNTPSHFKYYDDPYSFESQNFTVNDHVLTGGLGHFAGMWTSMTAAIFGMAGFNAVAIIAAESRDLEKDESIKLATRKVSLRIILLYALATFTVGLNVPYTDPNLHHYEINSFSAGQHSVFIIAAVRAHLLGWPHFFNAFFIFSASSVGINALYMSSRLLHALAVNSQAWPQWSVVEAVRARLERTKCGVPIAAVFTSWLFGLLGFLVVKPHSAVVSVFVPHVSALRALTYNGTDRYWVA
jgi:amino acid transporter